MTTFQRVLSFLTQKSSYQAIFYDRDDEVYHGRTWGPNEYLQANEISLYTNRAIEKRAEKVGEVEFFLRNRKSNDIIKDHPVLELLQRPNAMLTGKKFWSLHQKYLDLLGASFIWKEPGASFTTGKGKIAQLHLLRPDLVRVEWLEGQIVGYTFTPSNGKPIFYPADEVIYCFNPNPRKPTDGMSLLTAGIRAIDTDNQLATYHAQVLRNGGKVDTILKFKTPELTRDQVKLLKEQYSQQYASARNAGQPMFVGGDADLIKLGLNPAELDFLASKKVILDDICIMTGVPKSLLGATTDVKFDNADADRAIFLRETVKPLLTDLVTALDWNFVPDEFDLEFTDPTPENTGLKIKETESGMKSGYMTINEARERHGLEPVPDGDQILVGSSLVPLDRVGEEPEQSDKDGKDAEKDKKSFEHPLREKFVRVRYGQIMEKRMDRQEIAVRNAVDDFFMDQLRRLVSNLEGTKVFRKKDLIDEIFNSSIELKIGQEMMLPLIRSVLVRAGHDAMTFAGSDKPFLLSAAIESWLDRRAYTFADQITDTTFKALKAAFQESLEANESRQQLIKRIREAYGGFTEGRARTIARTEVHGATQNGTFEGYKQVGLTTKIWVAVGDENTRDSHLKIDGEEKPIDHPFSNGLMYPGDPSAEAAETINCRCSV